ncbi:soluble lytic murein transglycosylase precursor [mine drainage metagenome]|uniref:Soluble lytic murein transglycosylase n=1 Tax=mine drainage metagenome TaxID=410659 RepID=A0A1J5RWK5_9ZZZZ
MDKIARLLVAFSLVSMPVAAAPLDPFQPLIAEASQRFGIPESWVRSVIMAESGGNARAVSPKGAMGLMQLMPGTWNDMRAAYDLGADPFDARANILAGTAMLKAMQDRFGYPGLFAAYNAGPRRYEARLQGHSLPRETQIYLARLTGVGIGNGLFVTLSTLPKRQETPVSSPLFVPLATVSLLPR